MANTFGDSIIDSSHLVPQRRVVVIWHSKTTTTLHINNELKPIYLATLQDKDVFPEQLQNRRIRSGGHCSKDLVSGVTAFEGFGSTERVFLSINAIVNADSLLLSSTQCLQHLNGLSLTKRFQSMSDYGNRFWNNIGRLVLVVYQIPVRYNLYSIYCPGLLGASKVELDLHTSSCH